MDFLWPISESVPQKNLRTISENKNTFKVGAKNDQSQTPLHLAAQNGSTKNVMMLMYAEKANIIGKSNF